MGFVFHTLSLHDCSGTLYHHEGITIDQFSMKFGGDHGANLLNFASKL